MTKTATSVSTDVSLSAGRDSITLKYSIGFTDATKLDEQLIASYPTALAQSIDLAIIKNHFDIFLSQIFLYAGRIVLSCSEDEIPFYSQVIKALYAIRNYEESTEIHPGDLVVADNIAVPAHSQKTNTAVMNLVSGGKDSLVSDFLLTANGASVFRCFIDGLNVASNSSELDACLALFKKVEIIKLSGFEALVVALSSISDCYGRPPKRNYIPRGRDILTISLAYPLAATFGCSYISHGCERDLWENNLNVDGIEIPLHDSQSRLVIEPLSQQMDMGTGIHVFSPIAGMHEIYVLSWLLNRHPDLAGKLQSCFYGEWCGECTKCLRYYLIEKYCDCNLFRFKKTPEALLPNLYHQLSLPDANRNVRYCKELLYLTGVHQHESELFTPIRSQLFPQFFERWELE